MQMVIATLWWSVGLEISVEQAFRIGFFVAD